METVPDINDTMEKLAFGGKIQRVAEEELAASSFELREQELLKVTDDAYQAYLHDGKPRNSRKWLCERLEPMFLCAGERPRWVSGRPAWPFLDGEPMVFIRQFEVGTGTVEQSFLSPEVTLYVFGLRVANEYGWSMAYRVIQDSAEFRGVHIRATER